MFTCQVDTAVDFLDDDDEEKPNGLDDSLEQQQPESAVHGETYPAAVKPSKPKRLTSKTTPAAGNSLEVLDACLPGAPSNHIATMPGLAASIAGETPLWLRGPLSSTGSSGAAPAETVVSGTAAAGSPLMARLAPLAQRMRSLLLRGVYARGRTGSGGGWADSGRPAGFVGAGLAEELCLAIFGRIQGLRAKGVGKQVCVWWVRSVLCSLAVLVYVGVRWCSMGQVVVVTAVDRTLPNPVRHTKKWFETPRSRRLGSPSVGMVVVRSAPLRTASSSRQ